MTRILEVRPDDLLAVVEPGILNADLNNALAEHGAVVGAGPREPCDLDGRRQHRHGRRRAAVRRSTASSATRCWALDIVLADGRLLQLGHRTVKGVHGARPHLAVHRVRGHARRRGRCHRSSCAALVPGEVCTIAATFPDVRRAAAAGSAAVTASGVQPAIMELMDAASLAAVHALLDLDPPTPGRRTAHDPDRRPAAAAEADAIAEVLRHRRQPSRSPTTGGGRAASRGAPLHAPGDGDPRHDAHRGRLRCRAAPLPAMFDEIARVEREHGLVIPTVAHAGDGNLHPNFIFDGEPTRSARSRRPSMSGTPRTTSSAPRCAWEARSPASTAVGVLKRRWLGRRARRRPVAAAAPDHRASSTRSASSTPARSSLRDDRASA